MNLRRTLSAFFIFLSLALFTQTGLATDIYFTPDYLHVATNDTPTNTSPNSSSKQTKAKAPTQARQTAMSPTQALAELKAGNQRFVQSQQKKRDHKSDAQSTAKKGQFPFAVVLSCIDSRGAPEIIFDEGLGSLFATRIAGNVVSTNVLASLEFATKAAGAKLIVVMGHTDCGAVKAACSMQAFGHINELITQIEPAVNAINPQNDIKACSQPKVIDAIAKQNVLNQIEALKDQSAIIANLEKNKKIKIVGAMQDLTSGQVTFFDDTGKTI